MTRDQLFEVCVQAPAACFWLWFLYRKFVSAKPLPLLLEIPACIFKFCVVILMLGLVAGCADPDPLAAASGPLFPLNAGHWQPTPQDLEAPPVVADK